MEKLMHYYQFNIKDYLMATTHLSLEEDGCYRRILDQYYDTEGNLPSIDKLAKKIRAKESMVKAVLDEFFTLIDGRYLNRRADEEIIAYHKQSDGGKKGAAARWAKAKAQVIDGVPNGVPIATLQGTQCQANANHKPLTINQEPVNINTNSPSAFKFSPIDFLLGEGVSNQVAADWLQLRKSKKAAATETAIRGIRSEAVKAGISLNDALAMSCANGWQGFKADWVAKQTSARSFHDDRAATIAALTGQFPPSEPLLIEGERI